MSDKPTNSARADADCKEFFDDEEGLQIKIKKLAELVRKSKHFVAFTGAGISTSAGIADFRSGINTVLDTGAGKWAKQDAVKKGKQFKRNTKKVNSFKAIPTPAHMSLVGLMETGYLKYLISQNCDGLHRRSGIHIDKMSELHGNKTLEICDKCRKEYMRDYRTRNSKASHYHKTGRYCTVPKCRGTLSDTVVAFGENLPEIPLEKAENNSDVCDLMLSLGSSLTVTPAADMAEEVGDKWQEEVDDEEDVIHNLVIVNLQATPLDSVCSLRIFAKIDDVMIGLMKELELSIPQWNLRRFVKVKMEAIEDNEDLKKLTVSGVDIDGINATVFTGVKLRNNGQKVLKETWNSVLPRFRTDDYVFNVSKALEVKENLDNDDNGNDDEKKNDNDDDVNDVSVDINKGLVVELKFYGHYKEPKLLIALNDYLSDLSDNDGEIVLKLVYDLSLKKWIVKGKEDQMKDKDIGKLWIVDIKTDDDDENDKE